MSCAVVCVCAEKTNVSAAVKPVKNVSVAAVNQQQKDNDMVNNDAAVMSVYGLLTFVML